MEPAPKLPPKPIREQAKVLYAYEAQNDDELTIKEGDIITIIAKEIEDQGWYKGELNGKIGVFPDNFVECIRLPPEDDKPVPPRPKGAPPPSCNVASSSLSTPKIPAKTGQTVTDGNVSSSIASSTPASKSNETSILRNSGIFGLPKKMSKTGAAFLAASTGSSSSSKVASSKPHLLTHSVSVDSDHSDHSNNNNNNNTNNNNNDCNTFSGIESGVKLSHPTANRPKGPSNRRPPSYIASPSSSALGKEDGEPSIENGESVSLSNSSTTTTTTTTNTTTNGTFTLSNGSIHQTTGQSKTSSIASNTVSCGTATIEPASRSVTSPGNKSNKEDPPAWMVELRKTQELKRTKTLDASSPVASERCITSSVDNNESSSAFSLPPRASHRASGDFTARLNSFAASPSTGANSSPAASVAAAVAVAVADASPSSGAPATISSSILKPAKPAKPSSSVTSCNAAPSPTSGSNNVPSIPREVSATNSPISASGVSSCKSLGHSNSLSSADILNSPIVMDLQRELKLIKETYVPKKEFDELTQQVTQLRELFDTQSKSKSKTIKELINDLAEERKKLSALQIEVDRLRKLNAA